MLLGRGLAVRAQTPVDYLHAAYSSLLNNDSYDSNNNFQGLYRPKNTICEHFYDKLNFIYLSNVI